jgi:hypothetical protein
MWAGMAIRTVAAPGYTAHHLQVPCANEQLMCTFPHIMRLKPLVPLMFTYSVYTSDRPHGKTRWLMLLTVRFI